MLQKSICPPKKDVLFTKFIFQKYDYIWPMSEGISKNVKGDYIIKKEKKIGMKCGGKMATALTVF